VNYKSMIAIGDLLRPGAARYTTGLSYIIAMLEGREVITIPRDENEDYLKWLYSYENGSEYRNSMEPFTGKDRLFVGWEMAPAQTNMLIQMNQKYVNFSVGFIRFMTDLLLCIDTNDEYLYQIAINNCQSENQIYEFAENLRKERYDVNLPTFGGNLLIEQLPLDASSIYNKQFLGLDDVVRIFGVKNFQILTHPFSKNIGFKTLNKNCYDLMINSNNLYMYGVSSSLLLEAKYFGINTQMINNHYYRASRGEIPIQLAISGLMNFFLESGLNKIQNIQFNSIKQLIKVSWSRG
jgi:hypothetical protein